MNLVIKLAPWRLAMFQEDSRGRKSLIVDFFLQDFHVLAPNALIRRLAPFERTPVWLATLIQVWTLDGVSEYDAALVDRLNHFGKHLRKGKS